jgi:hypothetical protein
MINALGRNKVVVVGCGERGIMRVAWCWVTGRATEGEKHVPKCQLLTVNLCQLTCEVLLSACHCDLELIH